MSITFATPSGSPTVAADSSPSSPEATGYRAEVLAYGLGATQEFRVIVPDGYDARRPLPFVISARGNTRDEEHFSLCAERQALVTAILAATTAAHHTRCMATTGAHLTA